MIWDWLHRLIYWRQIKREIEEMEAMEIGWRNQMRELDRRIAELYTPEEWEAVRERCERKLAEMGFGSLR